MVLAQYMDDENKKARELEAAGYFCDPEGIRTPTASVKGW